MVPLKVQGHKMEKENPAWLEAAQFWAYLRILDFSIL